MLTLCRRRREGPSYVAEVTTRGQLAYRLACLWWTKEVGEVVFWRRPSETLTLYCLAFSTME